MPYRDLVCVCTSGDRRRLTAIIEVLEQVGIVTVLFPSAQAIGMWDIEVAGDDVVRAKAVVDGLPGNKPP